MTRVNPPSLILSPEDAEKQFEKQVETKRKIEELQSTVFKNYTTKKSQSVVHPAHTLYLIKDKQERKSLNRPSQTARPSPGKRTAGNSPDNSAPNVKNIKFGQKFISRPISERNLPVTTSKNLPAAFSPRKTAYSMKKTSYQVEDKWRPSEPDPMMKLKRSLSTKIKTSEQRDSQTILRKNSLFLVNCLKTRYKESFTKKAHIGESTNVANMRLGFFSEKNGSMTQYQQRFEYMQQARQRMLIARQAQKSDNKMTKMSALMPEPW